ncbi:MAG TPA: diaminopimelate decarboxylase [Terriglobales bacterium]|nr:diaminopimelate decarboxylase [Terriglobales bacterium]
MRPPGFTYKRAIAHCERVPLPRLAEKYGTPLYVYSASTIRERYRTFDRALGRFPHSICYSVKANSNLGILRLLARLGSGFDVVSGGELARVQKAAKRATVVFSGVGKTVEEMDAALRANILMFNVESEGELHLLAQRAARLKKMARIALRVNPDVSAETHPYISTGLREHKFGVPVSEARALYAQAARERWLEVAGVSVHIGSQITDMEPFEATMERVAELVRALHFDGHHIRYVDAGGGLGISYHHADELAPRAKAYVKAITTPLRKLRVHLILEPGRAIVAPAGALLTRVLYIKANGEHKFAIVDGAMNDLLRPSLYGAYHRILPVAADDRRPTTDDWDVVGPVCESGDFLARDRELPALEPGELLLVLDTGAYGMSLASNYNSRPRPAEVLVDSSRVTVLRMRETIRDLIANEQ